MRRSHSTVLAVVALFLVAPFAGAQTSSTAPGWDATLTAGKAVASTVTVVNRCNGRHRFRVQPEDLPFVSFPEGDTVRVPGGGSVVLPVVFDASDLAPGSEHSGALLVICESCRAPACSQDRDRFPAHFRISAPPSAPPSTGDDTGSGEDPGTTSPGASPPQRDATEPTAAVPSATLPELPPDVRFTFAFEPPFAWDTDVCLCPGCRCSGDGGETHDQTSGPADDDTPTTGPGSTVPAPGSGAGTATTSAPGPCDRLARACEEQRRLAWDKEAEAAALEDEAEAARQRADGARQAADDAQRSADEARRAALGPDAADEGYVEDPEIGRIYERHFEWLREQSRRAFQDWKDGRIDLDEYDRRIGELHGMDAFRRAIEAEAAERRRKVREAQQAARAAAEARGRAEAAENDAARAAEVARRARADAAAAREAYAECQQRLRECLKAQEEQERLRREEEERRRIEEQNRRRAEERREAERQRQEETERRAAESLEAMERRHAAEREAAEEARRRQAEQRRRMEEQRRETLRAQNAYLLRNIRQLGLIKSSGFWETPGLWDWLPDLLAQPVGMLAEEAAHVPVPTDTLKALGGLYQIAAALLDPCTSGGARKTVERLQKRTNEKTGQPYTLDEAITKTDQMCKLLRKLKAMSEQAHRSGGG